MALSEPPESKKALITAPEVANYVVCPEAWRLKYIEGAERESAPRTLEGKQRRQEWVETHDLSAQLRRYAKISYCLLLLLVTVVFLWDQKQAAERDLNLLHDHETPSVEANPAFHYRNFIRNLFGESNPISERRFSEIYAILIVLGLIIFMWDLFERRSKQAKRTVGLEDKTQVVALQGSSHLPGKHYLSESLGLSSKPNGLIREGGYLLPVDLHPMSSKVKDRHVAQLLVHLRLIEEIEKKMPPYGVLLMGPKRRSIRVKNSPEKQRWLETLIDEMHSIMEGVPAVPAPSPGKCRGCDVRKICLHSAYKEGLPANDRGD